MAKSPLSRSGVYAIKCVDGRCYVGGTVNVRRRWKDHRGKLRLGRHGCSPLQCAYDELGEGSFSYDVLEFVDPAGLLEAEQRWMDQLQAVERGFNRAPQAGSNKGYRHTDEAKQKMSVAMLGRAPSSATRKLIGAASRGRRHTPEAKTKMALVQIGRRATESAKASLSAAKRGSRNESAKLTEAMVIDLRRRAAAGESRARLCAEFGISEASASMIINRRRWKHI